MQHFEYTTRGTCSSRISFDLEDGRVYHVAFRGGCNGNLQGISRAAEGKTVEELQALFAGINCGGKGTSCPDQLARAVRAAQEQADGAE